MNNKQRAILIAALCLFAVSLPLYFLQYHTAQQATPAFDEFGPDEPDWTPGKLILGTGPAGSGNGIYPRVGITANYAALLGMALPVILLTTAAFLWAGRANQNGQPPMNTPLVAQSRQPLWGNGFKTLWEGGHSLPRAFWGYYVLGAVACYIVSLLAALPFMLIHAAPLGLIVAYGLMGIYGIIATVGVWRSAEASTPPFWPAALAKAAVLFWSFGIFVYLWNGGFRWFLNQVSQ